MSSRIVRTEGLVLRNLRYGDTSRVATLLTRELGKISVIGKGVREPKSPLGASLELFTRSEFVVYFRSGRNLQMVKSGDVIEEYRGVLLRGDRFQYGCGLLEFLDRMVLEEEPSDSLYLTACRALSRMSRVGLGEAGELFRAFQLRAASLLGYAPLLDACLHCGTSLDEAALTTETASRVWLFRPAEGGALCGNCAGSGEFGQPMTVRALLRVRSMVTPRELPTAATLDAATAESGGEPDAGARVGEVTEAYVRRDPAIRPADNGDSLRRWSGALERVVEDFLRYHVERYRGLRSIESSGTLTPPSTS